MAGTPRECVARHFAAVEGTDGLAFRDGRIVTESEVGGHASGRVRRITYAIAGSGVRVVSNVVSAARNASVDTR